MRVAAFENEPDAAATATHLREQGYDAEVIVKENSDYDERMRAFFSGKPVPYEHHALLLSEADAEPFDRAVLRHYGQVIRGDV
jgi:hypothetical protein